MAQSETKRPPTACPECLQPFDPKVKKLTRIAGNCEHFKCYGCMLKAEDGDTHSCKQCLSTTPEKCIEEAQPDQNVVSTPSPSKASTSKKETDKNSENPKKKEEAKKVFQCRFCPQACTSQFNLNRHIKRRHMDALTAAAVTDQQLDSVTLEFERMALDPPSFDSLKNLIEAKNPAMHSCDKDGNTIAHIAATSNAINPQDFHDLTKLLLETDSGKELLLKKNKLRQTVLHLRFKHEQSLQLETLQLLLPLYSDAQLINYRDQQGNNLLFSVNPAELKHVQCLLDHGADISSRNAKGNTLAHRVAAAPLVFAEKFKDFFLLLEKYQALDQFKATNTAGQTPLHVRFGYGNDIFESSLQAIFNIPGFEVNAKDDQGNNFFLVAVNGSGDDAQPVSILKTLVDLGVDPLAVNKAGKNALHMAVRSGMRADAEMVRTVEYLISLNVPINTVDEYGYTPVDVATREMHFCDRLSHLDHHMFFEAKETLAKIRILLLQPVENLEDVEHVEEHNEEQVLEQNLGDVDPNVAPEWLVQFLADDNETMPEPEPTEVVNEQQEPVYIPCPDCTPNLAPAALNQKDRYGYTPLLRAAQEGKLELIKELALNGADLFATTNSGETIAHFAWGMNSENIHGLVHFLLEQNAGPVLAMKNDQRFNVLHQLLKRTANVSLDTVKLIVKQGGVNPNELDEHENNVLFHAVRFPQYIQVIKFLVGECNTNFHQKNKDGRTCLHRAVLMQNREIVEYLVSLDLSLNELDRDNSSPLHLSRGWPMAQYLIEKGANPGATNNNGQTFAHLAAGNFSEIDFAQMVKYLVVDLEMGHLLSVQDNQHRTPLHIRLMHKLDVRASTLYIILNIPEHPVNLEDMEGNSVFLLAIAGRYRLDLVKMFGEREDLNWNGMNKEQQNALHVAVVSGHAHALKWLMTGGREVRLDVAAAATGKDGGGRSPLQLAEDYTGDVDEDPVHGQKRKQEMLETLKDGVKRVKKARQDNEISINSK